MDPLLQGQGLAPRELQAPGSPLPAHPATSHLRAGPGGSVAGGLCTKVYGIPPNCWLSWEKNNVTGNMGDNSGCYRAMD